MTLLIDNPEKDPGVAVRNANENAGRLLTMVSSQVRDEESRLPKVIPESGATPIEQLRELHRRSIDAFEAVKAFTACKRGCSLCCHYAVAVYPVEAELISQSLGAPVPPTPTKRSNGHGKRCPFLGQEGRCTIYEARPMVCRQHSMLTNSNYWCHPTRSFDHSLPLFGLTGVEEAFHGILHFDGRNRPEHIRDIRDYFSAKG